MAGDLRKFEEDIAEVNNVLENLKEKARDEGINKGIIKGMSQAACRMLSKGFSVSDISAVTSLPEAHIEMLRDKDCVESSNDEPSKVK